MSEERDLPLSDKIEFILYRIKDGIWSVDRAKEEIAKVMFSAFCGYDVDWEEEIGDEWKNEFKDCDWWKNWDDQV